MLSQLGLIAGMIISPDIAQFADAASQGLGLMLLKFGRDAERESDRLGVEYSTKIGYDAHQMAGFFLTLQRLSAGTGSEELPNFLSTHPNPGERNTTVAQLATEWKQKQNLTNPQINREAYLRRIEGLIYGEDPREGYLENNVFYHPVLRFQFATPAGWRYQNTPQRVQMAPQDGKAMMYLTLAQGQSLQEAANAFVQQNKLVVVESRETTINGLRAATVVADQPATQQGAAPIRAISYFIQYGSNIYQIVGVSRTTDFNAYFPSFNNTAQSFRELTDQSKLNKKPSRIRIKTVSQDATLDQVLRNYNVPSTKLEELAVVNGMKLTDRVTKGTLIKVIGE
jgi:predicted Zn-dependent protease